MCVLSWCVGPNGVCAQLIIIIIEGLSLLQTCAQLVHGYPVVQPIHRFPPPRTLSQHATRLTPK